MASSNDPDEIFNTETEEETIAAKRRRGRRVSFAETTAVHIFDRDEESDKTPPAAADELLRSESNEIRALLLASGVGGDDDDEGDDLLPPRKSFFSPFESPSPASSTFGSAASNDEENFFGPISEDFIKRGLSNSAGNDENHDITMDSATFSMHFRSLAKSETGGEIKTPTGFRLAFGEGSQTQIGTPNIGNSMVFTMVKSPVILASPAVAKITGSCNSNDMSLDTENSDRFDYGQLSPTLDALLAGGQNDVNAVDLSRQHDGPISVEILKKKNKADGVNENGTPIPLLDHTLQRPIELISLCHAHKDTAVVPYAQSPVDQRLLDFSVVEKYSPLNVKEDKAGTNPVQDISAGQESISDEEKLKQMKADFNQLVTLSNLNSEIQVGSILTGSISSLYAKKRKIFKEWTSSSDHHWERTRFQKQPLSCNGKESDRIIFSLPIAEKSISRLKRLKPSPFASLFVDKANRSGATVLGDVSKSNSRNSILDEKQLYHQFRHMDVPVACLEEQFSSVGMDCEKKNINNTHDSDFKMLDQNLASVRVANISEDDEPSNPAPESVYSEEGMVAEASLHDIPSFGVKELVHLSSSSTAGEVCLPSAESDSSLMVATLNDENHEKVISCEHDLDPVNNSKTLLDTPNQSYAGSMSRLGHSPAIPDSAFGLTPIREEQLIRPDIVGFEQSLPETPKQPLTHVLSGGEKPIVNVKVSDKSTSETEDLGLSISRGMPESVLPSNLKNCANVLSDIKVTGQKYSIKNPLRNIKTPVRYDVSEQCHLSNSGKSIRMASRSTAETVGEGQSKSYQQEQYLQFPMVELHSVAHANEVVELRRADSLIPESNLIRVQSSCSNLQNVFDNCDNTYSSKMKTMGGTLGANMGEAVDILHNYQTSLNNSSQAQKFDSGCLNGSQNLTDVLKNINLLTEKWFSSSAVKFDTHSAEKLEDIMANLQKFAASKIICSEICSQRVSREFKQTQLNRVADTKLLLYKVMYGKVKMQFMHLKKTRLLNQIELLQSAVLESKLLKSKCCSKLHDYGQQDNEVGGCNSKSCSACQDKNKAGHSIYMLKQSLEDSEREKEKLINSFCASLKMPKEQRGDKIVSFAMDHFRRNAPCWFLQQELQLCEVLYAKSSNDQLDLLLNYDGKMSQRFKLKHKPTTSISISSELINARILKAWPNMSAYTAFEFALSGKTTLEYTGPDYFARETQRISSLLSNLYDVVEEIKLAQIELSNLTKSRFHLLMVGRLDLQLTFINYNDGRRVALNFDMSCLNCGVYPSEIIPYEVRDVSTGKPNLSSPSVLDEIKTAISGLRGGYARILRLCRCVSNVIESGGSRM